MNLLIRYIRAKGQGEEIEQSRFSGDSLRIGRGTDQDIHLTGAVPLSHSKITAKKNSFKVSCYSDNNIFYKGRLIESSIIEFDAEFRISGHTLKFLPGGDDYDAIIEIHIATESEQRLQDRFSLKVQDLNISKRGWSWILFLTIFGLGLLVPASGLLSPIWMDMVRSSALPDDSLWLSGDLNRPHKFIAEQCDQCHVEPFVQVRDAQCIACHKVTEHHLDTRFFELTDDRFDECTDCHKEHSHSFDLTLQSQDICAACHMDLEQHGINSFAYGPATDFETVHPEFKVSMLHPSNDSAITEWLIKRTSLGTPDLKEQSNLKFSHQLHLNPQGINAPQGVQVMECVDCHETEPGGKTMLNISMEQHCQSCHQLTFDPSDPDRVVPHGDPNDVITMLREYYGFRYVYQNLLQDEDLSEQEIGNLFEVREARRPGRQERLRQEVTGVLDEKTAAAIEEMTKAGVRTDALQWAENRAFEAASNLFEAQACLTCHEVEGNAAGDIPWQVKPIQLTEIWFPLAEFSHEGHELMECVDCHQADVSDSAHDILMPDIANCRQCHGGENSQNMIPSSCTECHQYHFDHGALMPKILQQSPVTSAEASAFKKLLGESHD